MARLAPLTLLLSAAALPVAAQSPQPPPGSYEEWAVPGDFQEVTPSAPPSGPAASPAPPPGLAAAHPEQAEAEQVRAARAEARAAEEAARIARERAQAALEALQIAERDARSAQQAVEVTRERIRAEQQLRAAEEQARQAEQTRRAERARLVEELKMAEEARRFEQARRAEQLRQAEHARLAEQARREAEAAVQRARYELEQEARREAADAAREAAREARESRAEWEEEARWEAAEAAREARREAAEAAREARREAAEAAREAQPEADAAFGVAPSPTGARAAAPQHDVGLRESRASLEVAETPFFTLSADGGVHDRHQDVGIYNLGLRFEGERGGLLATMGGLSTASGEWTYFSIEPTFAVVATENFRWRLRAGWSSAFTRNLAMSGFSGGGSMVIHIAGPVDLELDGHLTLLPFLRVDSTVAWALNFGGLSVRAGWRAAYLNDLGHSNGLHVLQSGYFGPFLGAALHM